MVFGWGNGNTLNAFDIIREFNKFHCFILQRLFDYCLADCIDHLHASVFFNDADLILVVECEIGAERVIEIQIHFLFLLLHLNNMIFYEQYYDNMFHF